MIGAIAGSLFGVALLSFAGFCFYRWNKNKHKSRYEHSENLSTTNHQPKMVQSTKNEYITNHQPKNVQSTKNEYATNHQPRPASGTNKSGQKSSTTANDENISLRELQQEIQDLRQIIIQSNIQSTSSMRND
jgi:hypothetical protein